MLCTFLTKHVKESSKQAANMDMKIMVVRFGYILGVFEMKSRSFFQGWKFIQGRTSSVRRTQRVFETDGFGFDKNPINVLRCKVQMKVVHRGLRFARYFYCSEYK